MAASKVKDEKETHVSAVSPVTPPVQPAGPQRSRWYRPGEGVVARIVGGLLLTGAVVMVIYGVHRSLLWYEVFEQGTMAAKVAPIIASLVAAGVVALLMNRPGLADQMIALDERQHWVFCLDWYKPTQGKRARQLTAAGATLLVGWGGYALYHEMQSVNRTTQTWMTLGLTAFSAWAIFRILNMPAFVDFLIATEAEMNKISWPRWHELKQAVVVVLACVVLLSLFLFGMDRVWSFMLQAIGVLRLAPSAVDVQGMLWFSL